MSKIENPKKVLKNSVFFGTSDENALNHRKNNYKNVTIIFSIFCKNNLGIFYGSII
jgi:hypothetical protein